MAHRLKLARELAGLSPGQASKLLQKDEGWPADYLPLLENDRVKPEPWEWGTLADLYAVNVPWLKGEVPELGPERSLGPGAVRLSEEEERDVRRFVAMCKGGPL